MVVRTGFEPVEKPPQLPLLNRVFSRLPPLRRCLPSLTVTLPRDNLTMFVIPTGFEPVTYCLEGSCSIQLSYEIVEPAHVIQRMDHPAFIGAYRRTRTANPLITSQVLYQLKLCRHFSRLFD